MSAQSCDEASSTGEQHSSGFRFVIREITLGPAELRDAVPAYAVTLSRLADPDDERGVYWCGQLEQPVKHRLNPLADQSRYPAGYLATTRIDGIEDFQLRYVRGATCTPCSVSTRQTDSAPFNPL